MIHRFKSSQLTVNKKMKGIEQEDFSKFSSQSLAKIISFSNPTMDVANARMDTKLSTLKPLLAKSIARTYEWFDSDSGKSNIMSGWRGAGIVDAISKCRDNSLSSILDPFERLSLQSLSYAYYTEYCIHIFGNRYTLQFLIQTTLSTFLISLQ